MSAVWLTLKICKLKHATHQGGASDEEMQQEG